MSDAFATVPGARLFYATAGNPQHPALVFVHAGVADHTMWDPQVTEFARDYFVVRYDTRGFGKTETTDVAFSNRQDLIALLDHLGIQQAVLVGCSRAGQIVIETTIEFPGRVRGVVSVCGGLSGFDYQPDPSDPRDAVADAQFGAADAAAEAKDWATLVELEARIWADGLAQPVGRCPADVRAKVVAMCLSNYARMAPDGKPIRLDPPSAVRLHEINTPALIVLGDLDTRDTEAMAHAMASGIAGARLVIMKGAAHLPSMEQPDVFNRALREWLTACVN